MSDHPLLALNSWQTASAAEMMAALKRLGKGSLKEEVHGRVATLDLYCYLKARFGPPNGLFFEQRLQRLDTPFQWSYTVQGAGFFAWFNCQFSKVQVVLLSEQVASATEWDALFRAIKEDMGPRGREIAKVRAGLKKWKLVVNPYRILEFQASRLEKTIKAADLKSPGAPEREPVAEPRAYAGWLSRVVDMSVPSALLQMVAAVLGEAYVNLTIHVLAHEDVRKDSRSFDALLAEPIDVRVRWLYRSCEGFREPVNIEREEFKRFHSLMNRRNTMLHGNVAPDTLAFDEVWVDPESWVPLFRDETHLTERLILGLLSRAAPQQALQDLYDVRAFVGFVHGHLTLDYAFRMNRAARSTILGWDHEARLLTTIFDDRMTGLYERMWDLSEQEAHR
jgi:hypothetical protein